MNGKILLVDDDVSVLEILADVLEGNGYEVTTASTGYEAIDKIKDDLFDLVITDIRMAGIDGLDTLATLRQNQPDLKSIIITGYASTDDPIRAIKLKVDDYLRKPFDTKDFLASVKKSIQDFQTQTRQREELRKYREDFINTVKQIAIALENRDPYLAGHSSRVVHYSMKLGKLFELSKEKLEILEIAGYLHDLGQVEVRQAVLQKHGTLSIEEYEQVKRHPTFASKLLQAIPGFQEVIDIILHHHEKFDGSGYPIGLKGEDIPVESRILALAEAYVSLLEDRPHRSGRIPEEALDILRKDSGKAFDSEMIELLENCVSTEKLEDEKDLQDIREEELSQEKKRKMLLGLGHMYRELGQYLVARQAYDECMQLGGEGADYLSVEALCGLAIISMEEKNKSSAREYAEKAEKMALKTSKIQHARVALTTARLSIEEGNIKETLATLDRVEETFRHWESMRDLTITLFSKAMTLIISSSRDGLQKIVREAINLVRRYEYYDLLASEAKITVPVLIEGCNIDVLSTDCKEILTRLAQNTPGAIISGIHLDDEKTAAVILDIIGNLDSEEQKGLLSMLADSPLKLLKEKASPLLKGIEVDFRKVPARAYCLGNFRLCVGDALIDEKAWKTRKSKYLLAYIVSHWQEKISEDKIFDIFWGEVPTQNARRSLHTALCQARQVIEAHSHTDIVDFIAHEKEFYYLNPDANVWIDVKEYSVSISKGLRDLSEGRILEGVSLLQKAESLYLGDFLEGYLADWALEYRNALRIKFQDILLTLLRHFYETNRYEASMEYARKLIVLDNCHEKAYYYLIKSHIGMGNKVEAMRTYQRCVEITKSELGISPSAEIESLRISLKE